ncbi:MAG TPA: PadR family transcriptional regulator [Blastocatellia bacterium]|nr:PadR family transcriptional regulator [Blastocatellia bacterium]
MQPGKSVQQGKSFHRVELLQGTLDMLILKTLLWGPAHGHGIAHSIQEVSLDALKIDHGSLYPALQRLQQQGWIKAEWGISINNRRAKYYRLTQAGRKQLTRESSNWEKVVEAIMRIMGRAEANETD